MKLSKAHLPIVILIIGITLQALVFNRYDFYATYLEVAWILLIGLFVYFPSSSLPLISAVSGWLIAILSLQPAFTGALLGLAAGLIGQYLVHNPIWSLLWVRVLFASSLMSILALYLVAVNWQTDALIHSMVYIVVNAFVAIILLFLLQEPSYNE